MSPNDTPQSPNSAEMHNQADSQPPIAAKKINALSVPVAPPAGLSAKPDAIGLLKALRRRWLLALSLGIVLSIAVAAATWMMLPPGKATARTLLRIQGTSWVGKADSSLGGTDQRTHVALIRSRLVLGAALKQAKVAALGTIREQANAIEWLEKEIQADFSLAPEVLRISITGDRPDELVVLVNEVREAYKREVLDKERTDANSRLVWLGQRHQDYENQLRENRKMQRELEQKSGRDANSRSMIQGFVQQQLNWSERELIQTQSELRRLRAELSVQKTVQKEPKTEKIAPVVLEDLLERDPDFQQAQAAVRNLKADAEKFKERAVRGDKDPGYAAFTNRIKTAEENFAQLRQQLVPMYEEAYRRKKTFDVATSTAGLESRIVVLQEDERVLNDFVNKLRDRIQDISRSGLQLADLQEDMSAQERMAKRIADEEESLRLYLKVPERVTVVEEGVATRTGEMKRLLMAFGLAIAGSFGLVGLCVGYFEFRSGRVNSADEVVRGLGMRLVGTIPDIAPRYPKHKDAGETSSFLSEAVDATRTMLLRAAKAESLQAVMITSAQSGEGKTVLSTHLAASMAQVGHRVILVDADLRNPIAHQLFNLEVGPGLCELLRGEATLDEVIRPTGLDDLMMITAGHWCSMATRALAQDGTAEILRELRERYEFIIVDSSPVLPVVDPLLIGQHIDGTVLSVLRDVSRMARVYAAHQKLTAAGVRVLGAVVSGVRSELYGSGYGYPYAPAANQKSN